MSQEMPIVYPVTNTVPTSNHSSNGSYGTVFIVLAVIIILSAFACFLGRLFNKRQNVAKPSTHSLPTKQKHATSRNAKDGDIEFGYDKKFANAKVAAIGEPTTDRNQPFGEPKMVRPNSFDHEPTMNRPNSFQEPNKMGPSNSFGEPAMGRPTDSFQDPYKVGPNSYREPAVRRQDSFDQPAMRRPDSFQERTMGRPNSFDRGESQGDQMRFDVGRDNKLNFIPRTRPERY